VQLGVELRLSFLAKGLPYSAEAAKDCGWRTDCVSSAAATPRETKFTGNGPKARNAAKRR